ncbi:MAG: toxin YoeB [Desulfovibrionales bacterium]|nr:toxin YoeB [Desulfovibrionales bacterium]
MRLTFDRHAFEDLAWWMKTDARKARRIVELIQETAKTPFEGRGKPEPLKHELAGCWSRRIDDEHRLVYKVEDSQVVILACRYHYGK